MIPAVCPVLGVPFVLDRGQHPHLPSVDRLIPSKGYTKENVRVICMRANAIKNDATVAELEMVLSYMKGNGCT